MSKETKTIRSAQSISMLWPLAEGEYVQLKSSNGISMWRVCRGAYGWNLKQQDGSVHPTIKDIDGMVDFMAAILEFSN